LSWGASPQLGRHANTQPNKMVKWDELFAGAGVLRYICPSGVLEEHKSLSLTLELDTVVHPVVSQPDCQWRGRQSSGFTCSRRYSLGRVVGVPIALRVINQSSCGCINDLMLAECAAPQLVMIITSRPRAAKSGQALKGCEIPDIFSFTCLTAFYFRLPNAGRPLFSTTCRHFSQDMKQILITA
ncbi:hypothetical protein P4O66_021246, partial [Electrophorus voltai]